MSVTALTSRRPHPDQGTSPKAMPMPIDPLAPESSSKPKDWLAASVNELVAHILDHHHEYTRTSLARLETLLKAAVDEQGERPSPLNQVTVFFRELQLDLMAHLRMEENSLFPAILAMAEGGPRPIALSTPSEGLLAIEAEHQAVEELFLNIRMVTSDYEPAPEAGPHLTALYDAFRNLEDDLHRHMYLENHLLFPQILPPGAP